MADRFSVALVVTTRLYDVVTTSGCPIAIITYETIDRSIGIGIGADPRPVSLDLSTRFTDSTVVSVEFVLVRCK